MNFNNIKSKTQKVICAMALSATVFAGSSCTDNFERINKNPLFPDKEMEKLDDVIYGMFIPNLQKTVIPTGTETDGTTYINKYQVNINMSGDSWGGYLSVTENKFDGGHNLTNYFFSQDWRMNSMFSTMITEVYAPWLQIKKLSQGEGAKNDNIYSMAQIIKIAALHKATDMFGSIPYSEVGSGDFKVKYDTQESVYRSFFKELEEAINVLSVYSESNSVLLPEFDILYNGNVNNWVKYANSLMLRLAIRVRFVDAALAQEYAEKAVNHPKGLIESVKDIAQLSKGGGLVMRNSLELIAGSYNDTKMGATISTYLKGYNDPRIESYFKKSTVKGITDYFAVRSGIPQVKLYGNYSKPNIEKSTPTYWMKASEVAFLRAEGALAGWNMGGSAKELYEAGVRLSFQENDVDGAKAYLEGTSKPINYDDPMDPKMNVKAPSTITVKWNDSASPEESLERIITQKYLAIFPDGTEAWTEWRRTGYPRQIIIYDNQTNVDIEDGNGVDGGVRRLVYPKNEYDENLANVTEAVTQSLGGRDKGNVNVWWDKKEK